MLVAVAGLLLAASGPFFPVAFATDRYWDGGGAAPNWSDKNNWTANLEPTSSDKAIIGSSTGGGVTPATAVITNTGEACTYLYLGYNAGDNGTVQMASGSLSVGDHAYVGYSGTGTFTQTGGAHTVTSELCLGRNTGSEGTYTLSDGSLSVGSSALVGYSGRATVTQTGGTHTVSSSLYLGYNTGSEGSYTLSNGSLSVGSNAYVGYSGTGTFTQTGGTNTISSLRIGYSSSESCYSLSGGALNAGDATVGSSGSGFGTFTQTGGTHIVALNLFMGSKGLYRLQGGSLVVNGYIGGGGGVLDVSGGSFQAGGRIDKLTFGYDSGSDVSYSFVAPLAQYVGAQYVGYSGRATVTQTGGVHTVRNMCLGYNTGSEGNYTLSDGSLSVETGMSYVGQSGTGVFTQTGGSHTVSSSLYLGYNTGSEGSYTLSGGSLSATASYVGYSGTGAFTQTSGSHTVSSSLYLGYNTGSEGSYTLSDGSLTATSSYVGCSGTGTFTQTGGEQTISDSLSVGSKGTFELAGGVLSTGQVSIDAGGRLTVTGGTFRPSSVSVSSELIHTGPGDTNTPSLTVENGGTCRVRPGDLSAGVTTVVGDVVMEGGRLLCPSVSMSGIAGGRIEGFGTVQGTVNGDAFSVIQASGGELVLGDAGVWNGFATAGAVHAGQWTVTLKSRGFATLGSLTTLGGGTINAANGLSLGMGVNLVGAGQVNGKIAAGLGSTIYASGSLAIGDAASYAGFVSDGELYTENHTVTIYDRNAAMLGSLTQIGNASGPGSLAAPNGLVLNQGRNLVGYGTIVGTGNFIVDGYVSGEGPNPSDGITFDIPVVGGFGGFEGNVTFNSGFSPGHSPGQAVLHNVTFGSSNTLNIEVGGTAAGSQYDQLIVSGTAALGGGLDVTLLYGFTPKLGDAFALIDGSALSGEFSSTSLPSLGGGLDWAIIQAGSDFILKVVLLGDADLNGVVDAADYIALKSHWGLGSAAARADGDLDRDGDVDWNDLQLLTANFGRASADPPISTPEPATLSLLALGGLALMRRRRK